MSQKLPYHEVLRKLDRLREKGLKDSDLEVMKLKAQLRDYLDDRKKEPSRRKPVVPKLTSVKTLKLDIKPEGTPTALQKISSNLGDLKKEHLAKYALLGIFLAVGALAYRWYKENR